MLDVGVALPLIIFFGMGAVVVYVLRRVLTTGSYYRRDAEMGFAVEEIARAADEPLCILAQVTDEMRRRLTDARETEMAVGSAAAAIRRQIDRAAALAQANPQSENAAGLVEDLQRALRAAELIEHGRQMLVDEQYGDIGEGETAVKRGYLNLTHAHDAIRERRERAVLAQGRRRGG